MTSQTCLGARARGLVVPGTVSAGVRSTGGASSLKTGAPTVSDDNVIAVLRYVAGVPEMVLERPSDTTSLGRYNFNRMPE